MDSHRACAGFVAALLVASSASSAPADVVFESATLGPTGQKGGVGTTTWQFIGSRFHLDDWTRITSLGAHIHGSPGEGDLFAAVVPLFGPKRLPVGAPFADEPYIFAAFTPSFPSEEVRVPVDALLWPGDYGIVFGAGQGASGRGSGAMPLDGQSKLGDASFIAWDLDTLRWYETGFRGAPRLVVEGFTVPAPGLGAMTAALMVAVPVRRRRGYRTSPVAAWGSRRVGASGTN